MRSEDIIKFWDAGGNYLLLGIGMVLVVMLVVFCCVKHRQRIVKDYNRFVDEYYTSQGKPTPAIILRIQNEYIRRYNRAQAMFLSRLMLFKPICEMEELVQEQPFNLESSIPSDPEVVHGCTILSTSRRYHSTHYWSKQKTKL